MRHTGEWEAWIFILVDHFYCWGGKSDGSWTNSTIRVFHGDSLGVSCSYYSLDNCKYVFGPVSSEGKEILRVLNYRCI
jgi:hypothetical protein